MTLKRGMLLALFLGVSLAAAGIAQQSEESDAPETTAEGESSTEAPTEQEVLDAESAAVDEILDDAVGDIRHSNTVVSRRAKHGVRCVRRGAVQAV